MSDDNGLDFETDTMDDSQKQTVPAPSKDHPELDAISRHSFRLPIQKVGTVKVSIDGHSLDLVNIVVDDRIGIGVRVPNGSIFTKDEEIPNIQFTLFDQDFSFQGKIQHISPDVAGHYLCGIMLTRITEEERTILKVLVKRLHSEMFR